MMDLLLIFLLLGLVAGLKAHATPLEYQEELSGTWYIKAMVCDNNRTEWKGPKKVFPMTLTALEGGDLEVEITFWKKNQCHKKKIVMYKTDEPGKYTAFKSKKVIYIHELLVKDHYIFPVKAGSRGNYISRGNSWAETLRRTQRPWKNLRNSHSSRNSHRKTSSCQSRGISASLRVTRIKMQNSKLFLQHHVCLHAAMSHPDDNRLKLRPRMLRTTS